MKYETHILNNGIRLIHLKTNNLVAHVGLLAGTGSRDEEETEHGMAHLVEHMIFKGTGKRKAYHIISRLEDVGGEINAYTTKEETCVYASFMKHDYARALELLYDVMFHSVFPGKEIIREKEVIVDEINSYFDNPGELIFDDFEEMVFYGHPIGRNILGTPESLDKIGMDQISRFVRENYSTQEMVVCLVGNIPFNRFIRAAEKHFGQVPDKPRERTRSGISSYTPGDTIIEKGTFQTHSIIGNRAYTLPDERRLGLNLLNNILGGPGLKTRLNMSLREKNGYSYNSESHYTPYTDTGVMTVYFTCEKSKLERSRDVVLREFRKIRMNKLGSMQLSKAKRQLMGNIAISAESHESLMLSMAKSYLVFDKVDSLDEIRQQVDQVTSEDIMEIADDILNEKNLSVLTYI
ncbi:MAG: insulinase family protein [Bacteroidales bacterium]|nr:insulinase family protein [Bacteroidales bacterium]